MLRPLNAPEAREPRTGRQPTTTEADVRPLRSFIGASLPASWSTSGYDLVQTEAREPRTGRQPTTTEADVRPTADHYRGRRSAALAHAKAILRDVSK